MKPYLKKTGLVFVFTLVIIWGQFLSSNSKLSGKKPPDIKQTTLNGSNPMLLINQEPAIIYFWATWCGICEMMESSVTQILDEFPGITIAVKSGSAEKLNKVMASKPISWPVVNDEFGEIANQYGAKGVPYLMILDKSGNVAYTVTGYSFEIGIRIRLWLAGLM